MSQRELTQRLKAAKRRWGIALDEGPFLAKPRDGALRLEELFLAHACSQKDPGALRVLEDELLPKAEQAICRINASPEFVDEAKQVLRQRLLLAEEGTPPRILEYSGTGPLANWIRVTATRVALNLLPKSTTPLPVEEAQDVPLVADEPELAFLKAEHRGSFNAAFRAALESLAADERLLLRLHLVERLGIDAIAKLEKTHRATAARRLARARKKLLDTTRQELAQRLRVDRSELTSLLRLVRSQLDLSVGSFLKKG